MTHPLLGEVTSVRSPRARRISLSVRPSGEVRLVRPWNVSEAWALAFLDEKAEWVVAARRRMAERFPPRPRLTEAEERDRIETLRRAAKEDLPPRIERLARATGLHYARLSIRAARTKWGSCSGSNHISLSIYLMTLPEPLRDFVILHELCHTVHHDHSPRFHALLDRLTEGREREWTLALKKYVIER